MCVVLLFFIFSFLCIFLQEDKIFRRDLRNRREDRCGKKAGVEEGGCTITAYNPASDKLEAKDLKAAPASTHVFSQSFLEIDAFDQWMRLNTYAARLKFEKDMDLNVKALQDFRVS